MKYTYFVCVCIFMLHFSGFAQHLPGGVAGAEIWGKTTFEDDGTVNPNGNVEIRDFSGNNTIIKKCTENAKALFNFNPSLDEKPCFYYKAPLESADTHNLFIVSEPVSNEKSMRHISTNL